MVRKKVIIINKGNSVKTSQHQQGRVATLLQIVRKASTEGSSGLRPEETNRGKVLKKIVPSGRKSEYKGTEAGPGLAEHKREMMDQEPADIRLCFSIWVAHHCRGIFQKYWSLGPCPEILRKSV